MLLKKKAGVPGQKTSRSKDENQQQTQPTYDAESGNGTRATVLCCLVQVIKKYKNNAFLVTNLKYTPGSTSNRTGSTWNH